MHPAKHNDESHSRIGLYRSRYSGIGSYHRSRSSTRLHLGYDNGIFHGGLSYVSGLRCHHPVRYYHVSHRPYFAIGRRYHSVIWLHGVFGLYWPCRYYYDRPYRTVYIYESVPSVYIYESAPSVVAGEEYVVIKKPEPAKVDPQQVYASRQAELFDQVLRDESEERVKAAVELGDYRDIASVAILIDVLINDADPVVRAAAATSLGKIGDTMAYEALLRSAEAEHEPQMQEAAQKASEIIKKTIETEGLYVYVSSVFPPMNDGKVELSQYLEDMRFGSDDVRENAAKEMVNHKGTQATAALLNALINDDNADVRKETAESLGKIGDRMALPFLKWSCDNDPDESVRKEADKAVEKIYDTI